MCLGFGLFFEGDFQQAVLVESLDIFFGDSDGEFEGAGPFTLAAFLDKIGVLGLLVFEDAFGGEIQDVFFEGDLELFAVEAGQFDFDVEVFFVFVKVEVAEALLFELG